MDDIECVEQKRIKYDEIVSYAKATIISLHILGYSLFDVHVEMCFCTCVCFFKRKNQFYFDYVIFMQQFGWATFIHATRWKSNVDIFMRLCACTRIKKWLRPFHHPAAVFKNLLTVRWWWIRMIRLTLVALFNATLAFRSWLSPKGSACEIDGEGHKRCTAMLRVLFIFNINIIVSFVISVFSCYLNVQNIGKRWKKHTAQCAHNNAYHQVEIDE